MNPEIKKIEIALYDIIEAFSLLKLDPHYVAKFWCDSQSLTLPISNSLPTVIGKLEEYYEKDKARKSALAKLTSEERILLNLT